IGELKTLQLAAPLNKALGARKHILAPLPLATTVVDGDQLRRQQLLELGAVAREISAPDRFAGIQQTFLRLVPQTARRRHRGSLRFGTPRRIRSNLHPRAA